MHVGYKIGYYVLTRFFKTNVAMANGRAQFVADETGRPVDIVYVNESGIPQVVAVKQPYRNKVIV